MLGRDSVNTLFNQENTRMKNINEKNAMCKIHVVLSLKDSNSDSGGPPSSGKTTKGIGNGHLQVCAHSPEELQTEGGPTVGREASELGSEILPLLRFSSLHTKNQTSLVLPTGEGCYRKANYRAGSRQTRLLGTGQVKLLPPWM